MLISVPLVLESVIMRTLHLVTQDKCNIGVTTVNLSQVYQVPIYDQEEVTQTGM